MRLYRAIFLWLSSILLHGALVLIIASLSVYVLFGNKPAAKEVLVESGIYTSFVRALIEDNIDASAQASSLPLDDPEMQKIARQAFSPTSLKREAEKVIDQAYAWLDEQSDELTFEVNFVAEKQVFVELVGTYAAQKVTSLPICTTEDISTIQIFALTCRPEGVPAEFIKTRVVEDLSQAEFFKDMRYTEADLPRTTEGRPIIEQYGFVPQVLQSLKRSLWIFIVVFILSSVLFVYVRRPLRRGFRAYGRDLVSNSVTLFVATIAFAFIIPQFSERFSVDGGQTTRLFNNVADTYIRRFDILIINVTLQVALIGIIILMLERFTRPAKYAGVAKKSGLSSSIGKKQIHGKLVGRSLPPIQTSEGPRRRVASVKKVPKKYRKIGIE